MSRAQDRLNRTPIVEGMTIEEINRAAMQGDYQSLIPGTFASIAGNTANPYSLSQRADVTADFVNTLDRLLDNARGSDAYRAINPSDPEARQALLRDTADSFIRNSVGQYGMDFLADQATFLGTQLGEDYVTNLINDYTTDTTPATPAVDTVDTPAVDTVDTPAVDTVDTPAVDRDAVDAAVRAALGEPPTATNAVTPPVTTTVLPPANATPAVVPTNQAQVGDPLEEGVTFAEWQGMSRPEREALGLPVSHLGGERHFNRFSVGLGTQDPNQRFNADGPVSPPVETISGGVTFDEWQGMSRTEREALGLPVSTLGGERHFNRFSVGLGRQDPNQRFNADGPIPMSAQTANPAPTAVAPPVVATNPEQIDAPLGQDGPVPMPGQEAAALNLPPETTAQFEQLRQEQRVYETLRAQGVDDMSINLLRTRGADMLQYAREAGASTREEIFAALNQYSQEKGVVLPLDPGPLVYAISNVLLDQQ